MSERVCRDCRLLDYLLGLSPRELQVMRLVTGGLSLRATAVALHISMRSVRKYRERALLKSRACRADSAGVEA